MIEVECHPYGLGDGSEGLCLLILFGGYRILLDCGIEDVSLLISDLQNRHGVNEAGKLIDVIFCSHAHLDHSQGLWELQSAVPDVPIVVSEVTQKLLTYLSSNTDDLCWQPLGWNEPEGLNQELSIELFPVGHLPGAAACLLTYTPLDAETNPQGQAQHTLLYTGDYYLSNTRLTNAFPLQKYRGLAPDILILEGTLGTTRHPARRRQERQVAEQISQALQEGYSVLLPVPVLGLAQELILLLKSHPFFVGQNLDIWLAPEIAAACNAYLEILTDLPSGVQNFAKRQSLFFDDRVKPRVQQGSIQAANAKSQNPCIVMVSENTDLETQLSNSIHSWKRLVPQSWILSKKHVPPDLETYDWVQHSDGAGTMQLIHNLRPQHVVFVHGAVHYLSDLASQEELINRYHLHLPTMGKKLSIPVGGDRIPMPAPPNSGIPIEGELYTSSTHITIELSDDIRADPRWDQFSDTGVVIATWQGENLVLQGVTQKELQQRITGAVRTDDHLMDLEITPNRCSTCEFYRNHKCWNQSSAFYNFQVAPDGYCPDFQPKKIFR